MASASPCDIVSFNVATTAGLYAQITGLLAGFAFTAIVLLLSFSEARERHDRLRTAASTVSLTLFAAFVSFILMNLMYSVLAGEDIMAARPRAATEELVNGLPFGLAVIMLFHGLTLLMNAGNVPAAAIRVARTVTVVVAPGLVMFFLVAAGSDSESARTMLHPDRACGIGQLNDVGNSATGIVLVILVVLLVVNGVWPRTLGWASRARDVAPIIVLSVSIAAGIGESELSNRTADFLLSPTWLRVYLVGAAALFVVLGSLLMADKPRLASGPMSPSAHSAPPDAPGAAAPAMAVSPLKQRPPGGVDTPIAGDLSVDNDPSRT